MNIIYLDPHGSLIISDTDRFKPTFYGTDEKAYHKFLKSSKVGQFSIIGKYTIIRVSEMYKAYHAIAKKKP